MTRAAGLDLGVVNLAHRADRRDWMMAQARAIGMELTFFDAVNAREAPEADFAARFLPEGPLGALGRGDMACTLSHLRAMEQFLKGSASHLAMFEDDARLAADLPKWFSDLAWIPEGADLVKLEIYDQKGLVVLLGKPVDRHLGRDIRPMLSRHTGSAGYIITRSAAERLLARPGRVAMPIDHLLFNANISRFARASRIYQIGPALVIQDPNAGESDLVPSRAAPLPRLKLIRRELKRGFLEISRLPVQLPQLLFRGARLEEVPFVSEIAAKR